MASDSADLIEGLGLLVSAESWKRWIVWQLARSDVVLDLGAMYFDIAATQLERFMNDKP